MNILLLLLRKGGDFMKTRFTKLAGILGLALLMAGSLMPFADFAYAGPKPEAQQAQAAAKVININAAASEELQELQGVGPAIAERILQYRQEHGRFEKAEDLANVRGIGPAKFEKMKSSIAV